MNITEFAESRNVKSTTVYQYIQRHKETFKDHTKKIGNTAELDDEALGILDKVYPLPKPVQVIEGIPEAEHLREIAEKDKEIQALQQKIIDMQRDYMEIKEQIGIQEGKLYLLDAKIEENQVVRAENEQLKADLERIRSRSLFERILNKQ